MRIKFSLTAPVLCMLVYPCGRACAQWAQIASPTPGSQLPGIAVTFTWNAISGADSYWLDVGTALALGNVCGGQIAGTSSTCSVIPTQPGVTTIYVQLWTHKSGAWQTPNQYTYTAPAATAAMQSPTPGSQLPGTAVTFTWNAIAGADNYWLDVGTALAQGNICAGPTASTSSTCSGIPTQPGVTTIYVQLWTHSSGLWRRRTSIPILAPLFGFLFPLLVGRALACGDLVEGAPLRFHPHVGVAREHGARDVPSDAHDHLVARARRREIGRAHV